MPITIVTGGLGGSPGGLLVGGLMAPSGTAPTQYHVYANTGAGDAVDYGTPVATVAALSYAVGPLAPGSDWTFAVRAFDPGSGLEEHNVDARARILVSATGSDLGGLPNAPSGLGAAPGAGGAMLVSWAYSPLNQGAPPSGFRVYGGTPTISYAAPLATVPYSARPNFSASLAGLADGASYQFGVRAFNATGEESNATLVTAVAASTGPAPVSNLAAAILS